MLVKENALNKHGFTLIEVTLFFAVSGLLALVAFAGLGPRLRNVRFTDAVRAIETTTERQLSDFQSGVNNRSGNFSCRIQSGTLSVRLEINPALGDGVGSAQDCILNGKYVVFESQKAIFYPIVSLRQELSPCASEKLFCHGSTVVAEDSLRTEVEYRNGLRRTEPSYDPQVVYLQSPNGSETRVYNFEGTAPINGGRAEVNEANTSSSFPTMCFGLSGRSASVTYVGNSLQPIVSFEGC